MKIRLPLGLAFLLGAGWCLAAPADKPPPVAKEALDVVEFVHLGVTRPVFVRLHVSVDGKPYKRAWSDFMDHLFKSLDKNKDGVLSKEELAKMPTLEQLFNPINFGGGLEVAFDKVDADNDGKVTPQELLAYFEKSPIGGPLRFEFTQERRDPEEMLYGGRGTAHTSDEMTEALIKLLDTNKDGKLSREELAAAPEVLRKLDADDDEVISFAEFKAALPVRPSNRYAPPMPAPKSAPAKGKGKEPPTQPFIKVQAGTNATLAKQLLARYAPGDAKKLTLKASGLDEATFKQLDVDGDGELDVEELARFTQRAPDLDMVVRLGKVANGEPRLAVSATAAPGPLASQIRQTKETVLVNLDASQMEVESKAYEGNKGNNAQVLRQIYEQQFDAADRDGNGYLDENEAKQSGFFRNSFKAMDLDGDGKVFKKEMLEYLDQFIDLQALALGSQVSVSAAEAGRGLFDLIDTNRDGRLSIRELRNAVKLLERLDRAGDGFLSPKEVPRTYQVTVKQGPGDTSPIFGPNLDPNQLFKPLPETAVGPVWFRKMDLNRDGDVSRREFIGTKEEFDRIDTDHDGLISVEEANKYDALKRQQKGNPKTVPDKPNK